jgi:hypothetical protein
MGSSSSKQSNTMPTGSTVSTPQLPSYMQPYVADVLSRGQGDGARTTGVDTTNRNQTIQGTNFQTQAEYLQNMRQLMSQHQQLQNMPNQSDGARTTGVDTTNRNQTIPDISGGYGGGPALQPAQPAQPPQPPMSLRAMLAQAPANAFRGVPQQASRGIFNSQNPLEARGLGALQRSSFMKAPK